MNSPLVVFAVDYGSYRVAFTVSPSPANATGAAGVPHDGQLPDHSPPSAFELAEGERVQTAHRSGPIRAAWSTRCRPAGGRLRRAALSAVPPADVPPAAPETACPVPQRLVRAAERTARVIAWMTANSSRTDVTVSEIAGVAGISVRQLQASCRRDFGRVPLQLLRDVGLHRVHLDLTGQAPAPASIAEAAGQAGYTRVTRFNAACRERYGTKPALPGRAAAAVPPDATGTSRYPRSAEAGDG